MSKKSFTLIELLIVIGILAILVVTILITLNPSEAQKKTRDTKRMKDLATLQAIVQQWINDGNEPFCTGGEYGRCTSDDIGVPNSQSCNSSWIKPVGCCGGVSVNLCDYAKSIPSDPINYIGTYVNGKDDQGNPITTSSSQTQLYYQLKMLGSDYKIGVRQESKANADKVFNDGGNNDAWVEAGSDMSLW